MSAIPPPAASPAKRTIGEREMVFLLALLQALHALAVDAMLPGLGAISADLGSADPNQRQLVVGAYLFGLGLGSLLPGPLADRYGRRTLLLWSVGLYNVLTLACVLVTSMEQLIALRFVLGLASAGLTVVPAAMIRDRFEGDRMARLQSMISVIFLVVPMLAPTVGQAVLLVAGWRWIFGLMLGLGLAMYLWSWLRLPETLHPEYRQKIQPRVIAGNMAIALGNRASIGYVLGAALLLGTSWGYIQSSQQLVAEHFGAGKLFPVIFGTMALSMAVSNFTNSRIVERFGARRVSHAALLTYIALGSFQCLLAFRGSETLWQFVPLQTACMMVMGFVGANFGSIALQPFARIAGSAASVQAFVRLVLASLIGAYIGQSYDMTARPYSLALVVSGGLSLALVLFSEKGRLFRRLYPAGVPRPV